MRVALYARVSTDDKGQDLNTQLLPLRAWAALNQHTIVGEWTDHASALDLRGRVQWRELLQRTHRGGIDAVAVVKLDRAWRNTLQTIQGVQEFTKWRVGFVCTQQADFDTTKASGRLLLGLLAVLAEFEHDNIAERVKAGMARAKAEGKHVGRPKGATDKRTRKKGGYFLRGHATENDLPLTA